MTIEIYGSILNYAAEVNRVLTDADLVTRSDADGSVSYLDVRIIDAEEPLLDMRLQVNESGETFSLFVGMNEPPEMNAVPVSTDPAVLLALEAAAKRAAAEHRGDYHAIFSAAFNEYVSNKRSPLLDAVLHLARTYGDTDD